MRYQRAEHPLKLDGLAAAQTFFAGCFAEQDLAHECLWVAHVDDDARCIHLSRHEGDDTSGTLPIREIVADAAAHRSAGIILAHNHPSGDSRPSQSDRQATRRLATAAEALDCTVLDHIIFGGGETTSLRRLGYL